MRRAAIDPEGLVLTKDRELILTSEGFPRTLVDPFVHRYALDGSLPRRAAGAFGVPGHRRPVERRAAEPRLRERGRGRPLRVHRDGERALPGRPRGDDRERQPGAHPPLRRTAGSSASGSTRPTRSPSHPCPPTAFSVNGIVELLPLTPSLLIAMERSFSVGAPGTGNTIKLYGVRSAGHRAYKPLLLDLDSLGIPLDNVEGMTFGPRLRDGRQSLVLVSDNNFAATQFTQFLLFAI